ncbi:MAG: AraC family transcriptional regulator [Tunicatimonas sp.]
MKNQLQKGDGFSGQRTLLIPPRIEEHCQQISLIKAVYISSMGCFPKARHHYFQRPHGIGQLILIYCTQGRGWVQVSGEKTNVLAGDLAIIPPNRYHRYAADPESPWSIYWFHLKGSTIHELPALLTGNAPQNTRSVGVTEARIALFDTIYETFSAGYSQSNLLVANLSLHYFLAGCMSPATYRQAPADSVADPVDQAIAYMRANVSVPLKLADIAAACNLSASYFSNVFRQKTGYSPINYFNHLRMQQACQLLSFSRLRINEIAFRIGIDDPFYFSRLFKKQMGLSPLDYRRSVEVPAPGNNYPAPYADG